MNPDTTEKFPWTTCMMVFLTDKDGKLLLQQDSVKRWKALRFDTPCRTAVPEETPKVSIKEMVCLQMEKIDICTCASDLVYCGTFDIFTPQQLDEEERVTIAPLVTEKLVRAIFIYKTTEYIFDKTGLTKGSYWHSPSEIPQMSLGFLEQQILPYIINGKIISESTLSETEGDDYLKV